MSPEGRVVIPARIRRKLGLKPGEPMVGWLEDGRFVFMPRKEAIAAARGLLRHVKGNMADELIRERQAEAERE